MIRFVVLRDMPLTRNEKEEIVTDLSKDLKEATSIVFTDFTGLNVAKISELRKLLRQAKIKYQVAKKTLIVLALRLAGIKDIDLSRINGPIALVIGREDEVAPAKIISKFSRFNNALKIIGGILERRFIAKDEVIRLAALPAKPELQAKTVATIAAPLSHFVGALNGNLRKLVYILSVIKK